MGKNTVLRNPVQAGGEVEVIHLPAPARDSQVSIEQTFWGRRSVRRFSGAPIRLEQAAQLLWAAQGVNNDEGHRTAPSAGALYPLEVYLVAGRVEGLEPGLYQYVSGEHALLKISGDDIRAELAEAALNQDWMAEAPAMLVITGVYARTNIKYGDRTTRYIYMEVGAVSENIYLQAESLGLGTVVVGAFYELKAQSALDLAEGEIPLGLMPVGEKSD